VSLAGKEGGDRDGLKRVFMKDQCRPPTRGRGRGKSERRFSFSSLRREGEEKKGRSASPAKRYQARRDGGRKRKGEIMRSRLFHHFS